VESFFNATWKDRFEVDPRTKLLLIVLISIAMTTGPVGGESLWIRPLFALVPIILIVACREYLQAAVWFVIYAASWYCENFLINLDSGGIGMVAIIFAGVISKMSSSFALSLYFVQTTTVNQFITALEKLHFPKMLTVPLATVFRFLPTIAEENRNIKDSLTIRQLSTRSPLASAEYRMIPLLISMTRMGDELSAAALTKGLGSSTKRIPVVTSSFGIVDLALCFYVVCLTAFYFFV
jgi:energy-coupling factor transport system permease protein